MDLNLKPVLEWFGYSRRERRASFTLLMIIFVVYIVRFTLPGSRINVEYSDNVSVIDTQFASGINKNVKPGEGRPFRQTNDTIRSKKKLLEINSSDSAAFDKLPGIGPVLAARIVRYRKLLGGFYCREQLKEVYGLPPETYEIISKRVMADTNLISKTDINGAGIKELSRVPYLSKYEISAILKYRELKGRITGIGVLTGNKLIDNEKALKVRPYLIFDR
jgi:DNA uptake protein ComE-like DNA-binding protein